MTDIQAVSNGLGAPSMYLLWLACQGQIPATISITADTGAEEDRLWNTGRRSTAAEYFAEVVQPLGQAHGIPAYFVRACDKHGIPMPGLWEHTIRMIEAGRFTSIKMPLFGSQGGRLGQSCTQRWKGAAIRQQIVRLGGTTARCMQGLHRDEIHRMKGANPRIESGLWTYDDINGTTRRKAPQQQGDMFAPDDTTWITVPAISKKYRHAYPLVEANLSRADVCQGLDAAGIPYLESSECDGCPHKNLVRWLRTSREKLEEIAYWESRMNGEWFFTSLCVPLLEAIARMNSTPNAFTGVDFGCNNAVCGL